MIAKGPRRALEAPEAVKGFLGSTSGSTDESAVEPRDPFAVTCDPASYVPRPASEAALEALEAAVRGGQPCTVLSGPPGIGKTMLLRVLEARLQGATRCVHLPYAALEFDDLCRWVLGLLEGEAGGDGTCPGHELQAEIRIGADQGLGLLLLLDDASALPRETARSLLDLSNQVAGALQLVVVPVDDGRAGRVVAALGESPAHVRLTTPMDPREVAHYIEQHLQRAGVPEALAARFDAAAVRRLWRESGGNPRLLHAYATALLRGADFDPCAPTGGQSTGAQGKAKQSPLGP